MKRDVLEPPAECKVPGQSKTDHVAPARLLRASQTSPCITTGGARLAPLPAPFDSALGSQLSPAIIMLLNKSPQNAEVFKKYSVSPPVGRSTSKLGSVGWSFWPRLGPFTRLGVGWMLAGLGWSGPLSNSLGQSRLVWASLSWSQLV